MQLNADGGVPTRSAGAACCTVCVGVHLRFHLSCLRRQPAIGGMASAGWENAATRNARWNVMTAGTNPYGGASRVLAPQSNGSEFAMRSGWAGGAGWLARCRGRGFCG